MRLNILTHLNKYLSYKTNIRNLSYVEKCKYIQDLKENGHEILNLLPEGKFLVYKGSKPFLKNRNESSKETFSKNLNWLSYRDLLDHKYALTSSYVLLGVQQDKTVTFSIQLGELTEEAQVEFEKVHDGTFTDLRAALFLVSWKDAHTISRANTLLLFHRNYAFCSRCGHHTHRNASGDSRSCQKCKANIYPHLNHVGIVLVTDPLREHALLVHQPRQPRGMFSCIAGFGDAGESLEETIKREVAEEVGVEVDQIDYVASQYWPFPGALMAGCYATTPHILELSIDTSELESARWFTRAEVGEAIERTQKHPFGALTSNPPNEIWVPPRGAIAYHLIYHWFKRTPVKDIEAQIK